MTSPGVLNLDQLAETYDILGELAGRAGARLYMAKRKADGADALVSVVSTPEGDEGNALSHLAADANLMAADAHPALLPVLEARWLDDEKFALVTERPTAPTLDELLSRRDESFEFPRIAMVLRDVNGLLEWARSRRIVHRALSPESIFVEPGSDRILVSFEVRPLPLADMPGAEDDARTIATLARSMMTRTAAAPEREGQPLAELRPGLPAVVVEQTETFLAPRTDGQALPDISGYIAAIAMADELKRGETEFEAALERMREEERKAREVIEASKLACERDAKAQAERFEKERAALVKEREGVLAELAKERRALVREKEAMLEELAKERRALLEVRDAMDREREEVERRAAELLAQRQLYAKTQEYATPIGTPAVSPEPLPPRTSVDWPDQPVRRKTGARRRTLIATAGALALGLVAVLAALTQRPERTAAVGAAPALVDSAGGASATRTLDSSGEVAAPDTSRLAAPAPAAPGVPLVPADLISGVAQRAATSPPVRPRPLPRRPTFVRTDTSVRPTTDSVVRPDPFATPVRPLDSLGGTLPAPAMRLPRTDSLPRVDSAARRDSIRRDSLRRRDTLNPRDTVVRRDTMP